MVALLCILAVPPRRLEAQLFELLPESGYIYYPSGEGPGIPGCQPNDFQCDFTVSGTMESVCRVDSSRFRPSALQLSGNQTIQDDPPFIAAAVTGEAPTEILESD